MRKTHVNVLAQFDKLVITFTHMVDVHTFELSIANLSSYVADYLPPAVIISRFLQTSLRNSLIKFRCLFC